MDSGTGKSVKDDAGSAVMSQAVAACVQLVAGGGIPFVGVVVKDGQQLSGFTGNRVHETGDPTAHAEIVAMREVIQRHGDEALRGSELFATGEPCGMCYQFALAHGVKTIYVAVDRYTVAEWGFDYLRSYPAYRIEDDTLAGIVHYVHIDGALSPFQEFARRHDYFK